ncbi:MAG: Transglycosylase domain protein [Acidimicrobiales bacterium]|nr:Transglycosylase domain protein [Acidimicrobiales bacterium]
MSRTATGAVLVSALAVLFLGPELGFGPITSTSRADTRPRHVPEATVVLVRPEFIAQPLAAADPPLPASGRISRSGGRGRPSAIPGGDVWARLRACESPTNGGSRYRGYYQFSQSSWQSAGGAGDPASASLAEQTSRAQYLAAHSNPAQQWPTCWRRATG